MAQTFHVLLLPFRKAAQSASDELFRPCRELAPCMVLVLSWCQAEDNCAQEEKIRIEQLLE
jgi:hypothetical protein